MPVTIKEISWEIFSEFLLYDLKLSAKPSSLQANKSRFKKILNYYEDHQELEFNRQTFTHFLAELDKQKYSVSYQNNMVKMAKHLFLFVGKRTELDGFKYYREKPRNLDVLTTEEMQCFIDLQVSYRFPLIARRMKLLYTLLALYGPRIRELLDLTFECVKSSKIILSETKNGDDRELFISDEVYHQIMELKETADPKEYVFKNRYLSDINRDMKKRADILGIVKANGIFPHLWRHSVATMLSLSGADSKDVADFMGWRDINTTKRYMHDNLLEKQRQLLYTHHRMWKESQSFSMVKAILKEQINKLLDEKYIQSWSEDGKSIKFECRIDENFLPSK